MNVSTFSAALKLHTIPGASAFDRSMNQSRITHHCKLVEIHSHASILTKRRLKQNASFGAVANRVKVSRVDKSPEVVLVVTAVKSKSKPRTLQTDDGCYARGRQVPRIGRLQFHPSLEFIRRWNRRLKFESRKHNTTQHYLGT